MELLRYQEPEGSKHATPASEVRTKEAAPSRRWRRQGAWSTRVARSECSLASCVCRVVGPYPRLLRDRRFRVRHGGRERERGARESGGWGREGSGWVELDADTRCEFGINSGDRASERGGEWSHRQRRRDPTRSSCLALRHLGLNDRPERHQTRGTTKRGDRVSGTCTAYVSGLASSPPAVPDSAECRSMRPSEARSDRVTLFSFVRSPHADTSRVYLKHGLR